MNSVQMYYSFQLLISLKIQFLKGNDNLIHLQLNKLPRNQANKLLGITSKSSNKTRRLAFFLMK